MRIMLSHFTLTLWIVSLTLLTSCWSDKTIPSIDLSGEWQVVLDSADVGIEAEWYKDQLLGTTVKLPGTLDESGVGVPTKLKPVMDNYVLSHLTRSNSYTGKAWYQKVIEVPSSWENRKLKLKLERVLWRSDLWIDGKKVNSFGESLITPHNYELNPLSQGKHVVTLLIDNADFYPGINVAGNKYPAEEDKDMAHAYTNHTQIKWNGVLGDLTLRPLEKTEILTLDVYPDLDQNQLKVVVKYTGSDDTKVRFVILKEDEIVYESSALVKSNQAISVFTDLVLEKWHEFNPALYTCRAIIKTEKAFIEKETKFGFRSVTNNNNNIQINGQRAFMRGNLECVIFPLTGRPPMDKSQWRKLLDSAKSFGLNHLRFHSWCPPKAAFEAADEIGFYYQVELPLWNLAVGEDPKTNDFLYAEAKNMIREYGNHPSFIFFSVGNELEGDPKWLNQIISDMKTWDSRHLYTTTTFSFQKGLGDKPQPEDDIFVTQWTDRGWIRGQGVFNQKAPNFSKNYTANMGHINAPVISHEIGQYSVYPDLSEIEKYTGVLKPLNFEAVKQDLERKGLVELAPAFTQASGKLAALLYKEEIERAMRTPEFDGFQLLQLQDFPGQGTALVGLLNAFWESKGAITAQEFREFCAPVVPLLSFDKAVYKSGDTFQAQIQVSNFKEVINQSSIHWYIREGDTNLEKGVVDVPSIGIGNENVVGEIKVNLNVEQASQLEVVLEIANTGYKNRWKIWVYPEAIIDEAEVLYTRSFSVAEKALQEGKKVLLNPDFKILKGVKGRFVPVFWSPVHFPDQPSTMGILCDPDHAALSHFPTNAHSDWQWWDLNIQSKALILNDLKVKPIVRVIDNFVTNRKLGNLFEAKVGNGLLMFTSIDLSSDLDNRIVARQLRKSLMDYMSSVDFKPSDQIEFSAIESLLE